MDPRMPPEWAPHEATLIAWPTSTRRATLWGACLDDARAVHATVAGAVSRFEPVIVIADPNDVAMAQAACGDGQRFPISVAAVPIDDSWVRDTGPIGVRGPDDERMGVAFGFNGWGESFAPYDRDAALATTLLDAWDIARIDSTDMIFEGGSIAVDGTGVGITTERCLMNPNRNPTWSRAQIEARLAETLGVTEMVWCADGIAEDDGTDGHVDNVVAMVGPRRAIVQGCESGLNPNRQLAADRRAVLDAAAIETIEIGDLPYAQLAGEYVPVPYVNFYVCNGGVIVPTVDGGESAWLDVIGAEFPDRDVVPVPGEVLAYGGGGVHCITQQIIA